MSEKENVKKTEQETKPRTYEKKVEKKHTGENKKVPEKFDEQEAGSRRSRGKKQRRQFKLAPNRG